MAKTNFCVVCKKVALPKYKLVTSSTFFCSLECIKEKFNNVETINYESFKIANT
jgi:hypothetical protein